CKQPQIKVTDTKLFIWKTFVPLLNGIPNFAINVIEKNLKIMVQSYEVLNVNFDESLHTLDTLGIP
ncbi:hypothetical protein GIB67_004017, partial [Kingdonia uniflora]